LYAVMLYLQELKNPYEAGLF